jgi:hypothetical protein
MSMTLRRNTNPDQTAAADGPPPEAETQMRRALGLLPSSSGPRARSRSTDGPVVEHRGDRQPGSSVNRVAAAEAALTEERHAREQLARQLRDAETALREAQTKRGHAELARDEAVAALAEERGAREAAEERIKELTIAVETPAAASGGPAAAATVTLATRRRVSVAPDPTAPAKRRGRPPGSVSKAVRQAAAQAPGAESDGGGDGGEAVEWWVPGWQERV